MGRIAFALCAVVTVAAPAARCDAQATCAEASELEALRAIDRQMDAAVGLHVLSALLVTGGAVGLPFGLMALSQEAVGAEDRGWTGIVGGIVALSLGLISLVVAIALEVDGGTRGAPHRRRLREERLLRGSDGSIRLEL